MTSNKILIIDDDEELCEELSEILCDDGYQVDTAFDGFKGKSLLADDGYSLVILDLKLPKINGFEILKDIKSTISGLKVLVVSGRPAKGALAEDNNNHLNEEGKTLKMADGVLSKPLNPGLLLKEIKKLLS